MPDSSSVNHCSHTSQASILCVGELLLDWVCLDKTLDLAQAHSFTKAPGGAPANVAVGLAKLDRSVSFIGGLADDCFAPYLKQHMEQYGVSMHYCPTVANSNTRQAYVLTNEQGNRVFKGFTNAGCADSLLSSDLLITTYNESLRQAIQTAPCIYFGSVMQASPITRKTIEWLIETSLQHSQAILVYDPNYRASLWPEREAAFRLIVETAQKAHVVKLSDDEITAITGEQDIRNAAERFMELAPNLALLIVTCGAEGSYYKTRSSWAKVNAFAVDALEMTGAGDGFVSGLIAGLCKALENSSSGGAPLHAYLAALSDTTLNDILRKANALGALATLKPGAMSSLPTLHELEVFLAENNLSPVVQASV